MQKYIKPVHLEIPDDQLAILESDFKIDSFKFFPIKWQNGRINNLSNENKGAYIDLLCKYVDNKALYRLDSLKLDFPEYYNEWIAQMIVETWQHDIYPHEYVQIKFLDEQIHAILQASLRAKKAGKASGQVRKRNALIKNKGEDATREEIYNSILDLNSDGFSMWAEGQGGLLIRLKSFGVRKSPEQLKMYVKQYVDALEVLNRSTNDYRQHIVNKLKKEANETSSKNGGGIEKAAKY